MSSSDKPTPTKKVDAILDETDFLLLSERYKVKIDDNDVAQYKLCQIIIHLENEIKALQAVSNP